MSATTATICHQQPQCTWEPAPLPVAFLTPTLPSSNSGWKSFIVHFYSNTQEYDWVFNIYSISTKLRRTWMCVQQSPLGEEVTIWVYLQHLTDWNLDMTHGMGCRHPALSSHFTPNIYSIQVLWAEAVSGFKTTQEGHKTTKCQQSQVTLRFIKEKVNERIMQICLQFCQLCHNYKPSTSQETLHSALC